MLMYHANETQVYIFLLPCSVCLSCFFRHVCLIFSSLTESVFLRLSQSQGKARQDENNFNLTKLRVNLTIFRIRCFFFSYLCVSITRFVCIFPHFVF